MIILKMNKIINKCLLNGNKVLPELHLKQLGFTYSACGPLTKNRDRIQKFRERGNLKHLYRNELDKACLVHNATNSDCKCLAKRATVFQIRFWKIQLMKYDGYQRALASKFFHQQTGSVVTVNEQLALEFYKTVIKKF